MKDLEDRLKQARLAEPSPGLDRRMQAAFAAAERGPEPVRRSLPAWLLFAGGALGTAAAIALFLSNRAPLRMEEPAPAVVVYRIAPESRLLRQFLDPSESRRRIPSVVITVSSQ